MSAVTTSLKFGSAERRHLRADAATLGVALDDVAITRFAMYAELLDRWSRTTSLISCASADELIRHHLLDALVCVWPCAGATSIADLGSGAGLPGVPLAIVAPERRTLLVEPRRRRASFLREVKRELGLKHVDVLQLRAEDLASRPDTGEDIVPGDRPAIEPVDVAMCRAVWSGDHDMLRTAEPWIRRDGLLLCLRAAAQPRVSIANAGLSFEQVSQYRLLDGSRRRLDVYRKHAPRCFT